MPHSWGIWYGFRLECICSTYCSLNTMLGAHNSSSLLPRPCQKSTKIVTCRVAGEKSASRQPAASQPDDCGWLKQLGKLCCGPLLPEHMANGAPALSPASALACVSRDSSTLPVEAKAGKRPPSLSRPPSTATNAFIESQPLQQQAASSQPPQHQQQLQHQGQQQQQQEQPQQLSRAHRKRRAKRSRLDRALIQMAEAEIDQPVGHPGVIDTASRSRRTSGNPAPQGSPSASARQVSAYCGGHSYDPTSGYFRSISVGMIPRFSSCRLRPCLTISDLLFWYDVSRPDRHGALYVFSRHSAMNSLLSIVTSLHKKYCMG